MKKLFSLLRHQLDPFLGSHYARLGRSDAMRVRLHHPLHGTDRSMSRRIGIEQKPIFILSAGWRSGSTLLQRLIMSSGEALIWGEPHNRSNTLQNLVRTIRPVKLRHVSDFDDVPLADLPQKWIATMAPPSTCFESAIAEFLFKLYAEPALAKGASRWGIKEVRYGLEEALLLKWIYPEAKIVFLYRNPVAAFASYKRFEPSLNWYSHWPTETAFTARQFALHWRRLVQEFFAASKILDALRMSYHELTTDPDAVAKLENYCELSLDGTLLSTPIGSGQEKNPREDVTRFERYVINGLTRQAILDLDLDVRS